MSEILNAKEKIKELHNLLNSFEICYPVIKKNIQKYDIKSLKEQCYLAWTAGVTYYNNETKLSKNIFMDYFFEKVFETFNIDKMTNKGILFAFFCLGGVVSINNFEEARIILRDYYKIIAVGIVLIQKVKFDYVENGIKKWKIDTIKKYASFGNDYDNVEINSLKEFNKIINSKEKEKDETKILN